jgi:6-phosphogluconolactonase
MVVSTFFTMSAALVLPSAPHPYVARSSMLRMTDVSDEFSISKEIKTVRVFTDGDYAADIREAVAMVAQTCIAEKGSFSLAVPGGSVVSALGGFESDTFDFSKTHVFFCNEKIPSYPCYSGARKETDKIGIPEANVHGFNTDGSPAEVAAAYTELLVGHPSIDNSGALPSFDMMLLGTGPDGHCGCIFPDSAEVKATGSGAICLAGNDDRADGDFVALTMDVMCAAKTVLISASGSGRASMVAKALSGDFGRFDCPAGMVEGMEDTLWFTDDDGIAEFDAGEFEEEEEEE